MHEYDGNDVRLAGFVDVHLIIDSRVPLSTSRNKNDAQQRPHFFP